jgi:hypothetical protein
MSEIRFIFTKNALYVEENASRFVVDKQEDSRTAG